MKNQNETVHIDHKVRLSPTQKFAILHAHNTGGRCGALSFDQITILRSLKLIEQRGLPDREKKEIAAKIALEWRRARHYLRDKSFHSLEKSARDIRHLTDSLSIKHWYLTAAAVEYVEKGSVLVTR